MHGSDHFHHQMTARTAAAVRQRDTAKQILADLSEQRSRVVLEGSEAEIEEHHRRQAAAQRLLDEASATLRLLGITP